MDRVLFDMISSFSTTPPTIFPHYLKTLGVIFFILSAGGKQCNLHVRIQMLVNVMKFALGKDIFKELLMYLR